VGTLDLCPTRWSAGQLELTAGLRIDVGSLSGTGANIAVARSDARLWLDAGPLARLEWTVVPSLFVDAEAAGFVALTRPRFHFDAPDVTIHQPAALGGHAAAHLGGRFP
jgi:hypothetical protein